MVRGIGLSIAAAALTLLTVALWQVRFEAVGGSENRVIWQPPQADADESGRISIDEKVLTLQGGAYPWPKMEWPLGVYPDATFIGIRAEAAAEELQSKTQKEPGRLYFYWRSPAGEHQYAEDHIVLSVGGTTSWQRYERIFALTDRMHLICLGASTLAESGSFSLRKLEAVPLRQRPWVPWAAAALCGGWALVVASFLRRRSGWIRGTLAGLVWVVGAWLFVLPGPRLVILPIAGDFHFEVIPRRAPDPPPQATPQVSPAPAAASAPEALPAPAPDAIPASLPEATPAPSPPPASRTSGRFVEQARQLNRQFHIAHFGGMALLGFGIFTLAGTPQAWYPLVALSALSETVQILLGYPFGWGDVGDLVMNGLGVTAGYLVWKFLLRLSTRRKT